MSTAKRDTQRFEPMMWAELKIDCYAGDSCEEHEPYWETYAAGDMDGDGTHEPLILNPKTFPPGTKITIEFPVCPECGLVAETCHCGFDWKAWAEDRYS